METMVLSLAQTMFLSSMKLTNKSNLPGVIKRAVLNDPYDGSGSDISTTRLIAPPRIKVLEERHWDNIEEDV